MSEPFDLDALVVESDDAEPYRFVWGGHTYEMPLLAALPFQVQLQLDDASDVQAVAILLGPELAQQLASTPGAGGRTMTVGRMAKLVDDYFRSQGLERGKSPASPASSNGTAPRSKPTSRSGRGRRTN